jgi:hypothetical protein
LGSEQTLLIFERGNGMRGRSREGRRDEMEEVESRRYNNGRREKRNEKIEGKLRGIR